jgi:hypothetical protein
MTADISGRGEARDKEKESMKPEEVVPSQAAMNCVSLLQEARGWGEQRGFGATWMEDSPQYRKIREIGNSVDEALGLPGMQMVLQLVRRSYRHGYLLDHFWDGIGKWRA